MIDKRTPDEVYFGEDRIVYCSQHMRPHYTGWCNVSVSNKILLESITLEDAALECDARNLTLYNPTI